MKNTETRLEKVIEQVKAARIGSGKSWIFDDNGEIKNEVICGDVLPLLKEMKDYEISVNDNYIQVFLRKFFLGSQKLCGNTYNNNACISNDVDYKAIETQNGSCVFLIHIHLYGDIRSGYSSYFVLKFDSFEDFWELESWLQYKQITNRYSVDIYLHRECYDLFDYENQENLGEYYELEVEDLIEVLKGKEVE